MKNQTLKMSIHIYITQQHSLGLQKDKYFQTANPILESSKKQKIFDYRK